MERIVPTRAPFSFDGYRDSETNHYSVQVFYDALQRELSFVQRESSSSVGVVKFTLPEASTADQLLFFANELELCIRRHDLISRIAEREFVVLIRAGLAIQEACDSLILRMSNVERRGFLFVKALSDGTKELVQVLSELDNPQFLTSSKNL